MTPTDNEPLEYVVGELARERERLRTGKQFADADKIRKQIESHGYEVVDGKDGSLVKKKGSDENKALIPPGNTPGLVGIFGSGEMSPTGRQIHEYLIKDRKTPINIALLETPAGYEVNPHHWYKKLEAMLLIGLQNYKPTISRIEALRLDCPGGTNDPDAVKSLMFADYIHTGAGSPSYAARHLQNSLVYEGLCKKNDEGVPISLASAAAVAFGTYLLPVYELYFVGEDPFWKEGLHFYERMGLNITIVPHWNNTEGGKEIDTTRCYMGKKRFSTLLDMLPGATTIVGIDEHTALVFDPQRQECVVKGVGSVVVLKKGKEVHFSSDQRFSFDVLKI